MSDTQYLSKLRGFFIRKAPPKDVTRGDSQLLVI